MTTAGAPAKAGTAGVGGVALGFAGTAGVAAMAGVMTVAASASARLMSAITAAMSSALIFSSWAMKLARGSPLVVAAGAAAGAVNSGLNFTVGRIGAEPLMRWLWAAAGAAVIASARAA